MLFRATFPVLVRTKAWPGSREQAITPSPVPGQLRTWLGAQLAGVSVALTTGVTPVPFSATGDPTTSVLEVTTTWPADGLVFPGVNTMLMVHVASGAASVPSAVPQVPPDRENPVPVTATVIPVRGVIPVLCSVSVCAALVLPTAVPVNVRGPPVMLASGVLGATWYSTAPASTLWLVFLWLP